MHLSDVGSEYFSQPKVEAEVEAKVGAKVEAEVEAKVQGRPNRDRPNQKKRIKQILGAIAPNIFFDAPGDESDERRTRRTTNQTNDEADEGRTEESTIGENYYDRPVGACRGRSWALVRVGDF